GARGVQRRRHGGAVETAADNGRVLGVEQLVVGVGTGQRHDQRDLEPTGQPERERPRTERMEGMDDGGAPVFYAGRDVRLGDGGEIPDRDLCAALAQTGDDPLRRDGVAAHGRQAEGRQYRDPGHTGSIPRASRPPVKLYPGWRVSEAESRATRAASIYNGGRWVSAVPAARPRWSVGRSPSSLVITSMVRFRVISATCSSGTSRAVNPAWPSSIPTAGRSPRLAASLMPRCPSN